MKLPLIVAPPIPESVAVAGYELPLSGPPVSLTSAFGMALPIANVTGALSVLL